ncbi:hypothetical protein B0T14DRAFT_333160 [Immersiella caudata]|uniref:C2H2-type domain-containing protein n=1 Tax=Immersiella caudata TaxID=314043 RepID=A0AA39TSZ2_9PEZI|nr:hypothetical protein B0T14DRAFT_333160 [Immersiella caudata]
MLENCPGGTQGPFTDSGYSSALGVPVTRSLAHNPDAEADRDDTTVYTGTTSVDDSHRRSHVQELANEIYRQLQLDENTQEWESISKQVPNLIKAFAIRVGSFFGTSAGRSAMRFLHKHSSDFVSVVDNLLILDDDRPKGSGNGLEIMSLAEKMDLWANRNDVADERKHEDLFEGVVDEDDKLDAAAVELLSYRNNLVGSPPYNWLMSTLRRDLKSIGNAPEIAIRNQLLEMLPSGEISRRHPPKTHSVTFEIAWDILRTINGRPSEGKCFSGAEVYLENENSDGSLVNVLRYSQSRWPSGGEEFLSMLDAIRRHDSLMATSSSCISSSDSFKLSARVLHHTLRVAVNGLSYFVAERGEQLAWLAVNLNRHRNRGRTYEPYLNGEGFIMVPPSAASSPGETMALEIQVIQGDHVTMWDNRLAEAESEESNLSELALQLRDLDVATSPPTVGTYSDRSATGRLRESLLSLETTTSRQSSLDSDMLSISDRSEHIDPFSKPPEASVIFNEILHRLLDDWGRNKCCQSSPKQSSQSSGATQRGGSTSDSSTSISRGGQKRPLRPSDNDDELDDGDSDLPRPKKGARTELPPRKCFACPFWKKKPRAHRDCFGYKLSRIKDVKQHLARQHTPIHCERCLKVFHDRQSKREHFESDEPCVRGQHGELDGVSNEQNEDLRRKSKRGQTESEQWFAIWHILFPRITQPDSPYMDFEQSQEFAEWEEFCQKRGPAIVAEEMNRYISAGSSSPDWLPELLQMAQSGFRAAFEEFRAQNGSSFSSSETDDVDGNWAEIEEQAVQADGEESSTVQHRPVVDQPTGTAEQIDIQLNVNGQNFEDYQQFGDWLDWGESSLQ